MLALSVLTDSELHDALVLKAGRERELLAEIIEHIAEVDRRKLYVQYDCKNLFDYMTRVLKYSAGSAQRRIDAARLLADVPDLKSNLQNGLLNLTQVSIVAQSIKAAKKESRPKTTIAQKRLMLNQVRGKTISQSQLIAAQELKISPITFEKKKTQADESVRIELNLTKEQAALLEQAQLLISHVDPGASIATVMEAALREFVKKRDPASIKRPQKTKSTSTMEVNPSPASPALNATSFKRSPIPAQTKRDVFQKYQYCQWRHDNGEICGSKFQLQIDHIQSVCKGGTNEAENLQVLCSAHNKIKYLEETCRPK